MGWGDLARLRRRRRGPGTKKRIWGMTGTEMETGREEGPQRTRKAVRSRLSREERHRPIR